MNSHRRGIAAIAIAVLVALAGASSASAAAYKFKMDISIKQSVSWQSGWKTSILCGPSYRHVYAGNGRGGFTVTGKGIPVTFKGGSGGMSTSDFAIPSHSTQRTSAYTIAGEGDPGDNCNPEVAAFAPIDTSSCGSKKYKSKDKRWALVVIRGRLAPFGSIDDRYGVKCPDETSWSVATKGGASKQRKDVHKLVANKRVRSIQLSASKAASSDPGEPDLTAKDFILPGDQKTITGFGFASYKWSVKLTRVR